MLLLESKNLMGGSYNFVHMYTNLNKQYRFVSFAILYKNSLVIYEWLKRSIGYILYSGHYYYHDLVLVGLFCNTQLWYLTVAAPKMIILKSPQNTLAMKAITLLFFVKVNLIPQKL